MLALLALLAFASCGPLQKQLCPSAAEHFIRHLAAAIQDPKVAAYIPIESLSILRAMQQGNSPPCCALLDYIVQDDELAHFATLGSHAGHTWSALVNRSFEQFCFSKDEDGRRTEEEQLRKEHAKRIIQEIVIPAHPLLSQPECLRHIDASLDEFIDEKVPILESFISEIATHCFATRLSEILTQSKEFPRTAQRKLRILLHSYKKSMFRTELLSKYACVFLMTVGIGDIGVASDVARDSFAGLYYNVHNLACVVHTRMARKSPEKALEAQEALKNVLSSKYPKDGGGKTYEKVIRTYALNEQASCDAEEAVEPKEQVDPEELNQFIAEALENPLVLNRLSPECVLILRAYQADSEISRTYLDYCRQKRSPQEFEEHMYDHSFWSRLVHQTRHDRRLIARLGTLVRRLICQVVIPSHPIFSEAGYYNFEHVIELSLNGNDNYLEVFCSQASKAIFRQKITQFFATPDHPLYNSQCAYDSFLARYKAFTNYEDLASKYACSFLQKVPFEHVGALALAMVNENVFDEEDVCSFANSVYDSMQSECSSALDAQETLRDIWPEVYDRVAGFRSYELVTMAYEDTEKKLQHEMAPEERSIGREQFRSIIRQTLSSHSLKKTFLPFEASILRAFYQDSEDCRGFFQFVFLQDIQNRSIIFPGCYEFWHTLIDYRFHQFARENSEQAQKMVEQLLIRGHPFSQEIQSRFDIGLFLQDPALTLEGYINAIVERIFFEEWAKILEADVRHAALAQQKLTSLLEKYSSTSFPKYGCELAPVCAFLVKAPFEDFKRQAAITPLATNQKIQENLVRLSEDLYNLISLERPEQAQQVLESISPHLYHQMLSKSYHGMIKVCEQGEIKRIDPEEFRDVVTATLQAPEALHRLNSLYVPILRAFDQDLPACQPFVEYICENYRHLRYQDIERNPESWPLLVDEYLRTFAKVQRQKHKACAEQIVRDTVISTHPFSFELYTLFDIGAFVHGPAQGLDKFIKSILQGACSEKWTEILKNPDTAGAQNDLRELSERYRRAFSDSDITLKYICALLASVPLEYLRRQSFVVEPFGDAGLDSLLGEFAAGLYELMERESAEEARQALRSVLPQVYDKLDNKSYSAVMSAYASSQVEPETGGLPQPPALTCRII